jgi:hypothetical protein
VGEAQTDVGEVEACSDVYEAALRRNDVDVLNSMFWDHPELVRFGIADQQCGHAELVAWRASAPAISAARRITSRRIVSLAPGVVAVDVTFADDDHTIGRQSQVWIRADGSWRIARAHVSLIPI